MLLPALVAAIVLDAGILSMSHGARLFDPWLVIVVAVATRGRKVDAMLIASAVGLVQDLTGGMLFGLHLLSKVTIAYLASMFAGRLVPGQPMTALVLLGGGTLVEEIVVLATGIVLGQELSPRTPLELGVSVVLNVAVGMAALSLLERRRSKRPGLASARSR